MAMELLQQIRDAEARAEQTIVQTRQKAAEKIAQAHKLIAEKLEKLRKGRSERITQAVDQAKGQAQQQAKKISQNGKKYAQQMLQTAQGQIAAAVDLDVGIGFQEDGNPLYCDGNKESVLAGDGGDSLGTMQINSKVHGLALEFEKNVRVGVSLLIGGYNYEDKKFVPTGMSYSGWTRALRSYNGLVSVGNN